MLLLGTQQRPPSGCTHIWRSVWGKQQPVVGAEVRPFANRQAHFWLVQLSSAVGKSLVEGGAIVTQSQRGHGVVQTRAVEGYPRLVQHAVAMQDQPGQRDPQFSAGTSTSEGTTEPGRGFVPSGPHAQEQSGVKVRRAQVASGAQRSCLLIHPLALVPDGHEDLLSLGNIQTSGLVADH